MRGDADIQAPGTVIAGKYRVERTLGSGGMGVVLAVRHTQLDELYALKLMLPAAAASAAARERFAREAKAAAKLRSEHVARAIDFGFVEDDGPPYMVLELLTGQNLAERLVSGGPVDPKNVAGWMLQACEALREAHEDGIIHRDLKPSNLFLTRRSGDAWSLKVLDFGIAKTIAADAGALTKTATTMGSPFYMSPEQMRSAKNADARSDIWSLGVTMYELTTGRVPFLGETVTEVAIAVIECAVESPRTHRPDLPEEFERIVMRCLEKQPARRYASVDQLAEALAAFTGASWSMRPNAASGAIDAGRDQVPQSPSGIVTDDALAQTEQAASTRSSSQAETIAASPVLTLLGSSSASTVDPVEKPAPVAGAAERRRPRAWLIPAGVGAAAISVVGLVFFRGAPAADEAPPSEPAAAAPVDSGAPALPRSSAELVDQAIASNQASNLFDQAQVIGEPLQDRNDYGADPPAADTSSSLRSRTYQRPSSSNPGTKKSKPKLAPPEINKRPPAKEPPRVQEQQQTKQEPEAIESPAPK